MTDFLSHKLGFNGEIFEPTMYGGCVKECLIYIEYNRRTAAGTEANVQVAFKRLFLLISQASLTTKPDSISQ